MYQIFGHYILISLVLEFSQNFCEFYEIYKPATVIILRIFSLGYFWNYNMLPKAIEVLYSEIFNVYFLGLILLITIPINFFFQIYNFLKIPEAEWNYLRTSERVLFYQLSLVVIVSEVYCYSTKIYVDPFIRAFLYILWVIASFKFLKTIYLKKQYSLELTAISILQVTSGIFSFFILLSYPVLTTPIYFLWEAFEVVRLISVLITNRVLKKNSLKESKSALQKDIFFSLNTIFYLILYVLSYYLGELLLLHINSFLCGVISEVLFYWATTYTVDKNNLNETEGLE